MTAWRVLPLLALPLSAAALVLALLAFSNATYWSVNATLPPVLKTGNASLYPLARSWYVLGPVNATYYYIKFMPGWPESYVVGALAARESGWSARLVEVSASGNPGGSFAISLGGQVEISNTQTAGPYVPVTAPLRWSMTATSRYSVLARALINKGGIYAWQWVNFTAEPMAKLRGWTFSCPGVVQTWTWTCRGSVTYSDPLAYSSAPSYISEYTVYSTSTLSVPPVQYLGSYIRTQIDATPSSPGISAVLYDVTARWGRIPAAGAVISITGTYYRNAGDTQNNVAYLSVAIDTTGSGEPDVELIAYVWDISGDNYGLIYSLFVNQGTQVAMIGSSGYPTSSVPSAYGLIRAQAVTNGTTFTINVTIPSTMPGYIVGVGFAVVDPYGYSPGSPYGDFWVNWQSLKIQTGCQAPSGVQTVTRGQPYTSVYITPGNKLATEVDAYGANGNPTTDYGISAVVIPAVFNATGASISAYADYYRGVTDARNNVVYLDVLVDPKFNGTGSLEYIYYYYDTADGNGVIVSPFTGQVVCTVSSTGSCTPSSSRYIVTNLGAMSSPQRLTFSVNLNVAGAVRAIALAATDASYYDQNIDGDVYAFWGPVTAFYYSCPPPSGWLGSGTYYWQTNYALFLANATAYTSLVPGALTYVSNFTGSGLYAVFTPSLSSIFGVAKTGSAFYAVCGGTSVSLGSYPSARYVELRPLNGFGDIIIRDSYGNILARYGCYFAATPYYVGFQTQTGQQLRVYNIAAWG
ncbi:MAG: hypothetical protein ACP5MH_06095 [Thermoproteus sp.]